jgi:hypothetical protein
MSSSAENFCDRCAGIDFKFFTEIGRKKQIQVHADIVWTTLRPKSCEFCQLLSHCLRHSQGNHFPLQGNLRGVYTVRELQIHVDNNGTTQKLEYSIRNCQSEAPIELDESLHTSDCFDSTELVGWLQECDEQHPCLPESHSKNPLPNFLRLVDVYKMSIVQPKKFVKYCALSYVWGSIKQPFLTANNSLESLNALDSFELPTTIMDAMALCRVIGCQYLWVDSLCIVQDSEEIKAQQIASMAEVYSQSYLGIIAAAGDDANAGLSPFAVSGRKVPVSSMVIAKPFGRFVASLSPQIAAEAISRSTWASRGWTLQEYALSRRVLFFTGTYVFFRCETALLCEDFGLGFSACSEKRMNWDLPLPPFYRIVPGPIRHFPGSFSLLLGQYLRRNLRYDEDILDAFTGILTRMKDKIGIHLWGLPSNALATALQWKTDQPFPTTQRAGFPSWSWAGWSHKRDSTILSVQSHDVYNGFDEVLSNLSAVTCYTAAENNTFRQIENCNLEYFKPARSTCPVSGDGNYDFQLEIDIKTMFPSPPHNILSSCISLKRLVPRLSHCLFIWASCASLYVDRKPHSFASGLCDFSIRVSEAGDPIGEINLRPEWRQAETNSYMDFFVSTMSIQVDSDKTSSTADVKFKVILIQRTNSGKTPLYRRIQVSHTSIHQLDWGLASPESHLIPLI